MLFLVIMNKNPVVYVYESFEFVFYGLGLVCIVLYRNLLRLFGLLSLVCIVIYCVLLFLSRD